MSSVAETDSGGQVLIDGSPVGILAKRRQPVDDLVVTVAEGDHAPREPSLFTRIHIHFVVRGPSDEGAVRRAPAPGGAHA